MEAVVHKHQFIALKKRSLNLDSPAAHYEETVGKDEQMSASFWR